MLPFRENKHASQPVVDALELSLVIFFSLELTILICYCCWRILRITICTGEVAAAADVMHHLEGSKTWCFLYGTTTLINNSATLWFNAWAAKVSYLEVCRNAACGVVLYVVVRGLDGTVETMICVCFTWAVVIRCWESSGMLIEVYIVYLAGLDVQKNKQGHAKFFRTLWHFL
jgi:hypothetical protein